MFHDFLKMYSYHRRYWYCIALIVFPSFIVSTVFPDVDLYISGLFYSQSEGKFFLNDYSILEFLRKIVLACMYATFLVALFFSTLSITSIRIPLYANLWRYILTLYLVGPILLVNGLLKSFVGRARPDNIREFGGEKIFARAFELSDQCQMNCSFVSGEGSGSAVLFISVWVTLQHPKFQKVRNPLNAIAFVVAFLGIAMRVIVGRHFFSDALFSVLFTLIVAMLMYPLFFEEKTDIQEGIKLKNP